MSETKPEITRPRSKKRPVEYGSGTMTSTLDPDRPRYNKKESQGYRTKPKPSLDELDRWHR